MTKTAKQVLDIARKHIGVKEGTQQHKNILDRYNNHKPLAVGYKVKSSDDWCDVFVSSVFIEAGETGLSGTECGVERHIQLFKKLGVWEENGSITPKSGYIITYNWGDTTQSNDGFADHIGFVESVSNGMITTIEGNYSNMVKRRTLPVGSGVIRGYAKPKYASEPSSVVSKPVTGVNHKVVKNDTLWDIGKKYGVSVQNLKDWNGLKSDTIQIGKVLLVAKGTNTYIVKSGDTLGGIAKKVGSTITKLKDKNNIKDVNKISIGQKINY